MSEKFTPQAVAEKQCALRHSFVACCTVLQDVNTSILFLLVFRLFLCVAFVDNTAVNALFVFHVHFQSRTLSAPTSGIPIKGYM